MKADEVKQALRRRHPALAEYGGPGAWTVLEEFANIDLLAFAAWSSAKPPIVGYEVKIARGDYRRELLKPSKRALAVEGCFAFYFATPKGLLTKEEKAYVEPEHFEDGSAFIRETCSARCRSPSRERWGGSTDSRKWGRWEDVPIALGDSACRLRQHLTGEKAGDEIDPRTEPAYLVGGPRRTWRVCETCGGCGYLRKSVVEEEAPTLWIPPDVGLVEVDHDRDGQLRCRTVRKAPVEAPTRELGPIGQLVRWASYRPDFRHATESTR